MIPRNVGTQPAAYHYELGKKLAPLRDEGVLIVDSGNLVHNLRAYAFGQPDADPFDWAVRFDAQTREMIAAGEERELIHYEKLGKDSLLSIPTPEHFLPLLYIVAARQREDIVTFPVEGIDGRSVSMLSVQIG
jgi:4,5-DOPA dioxygenase extradiol